MILKVKSDDAFGREVFEKLFQGRRIIEGDFEYVKRRILELLSRHTNSKEHRFSALLHGPLMSNPVL